MILGNLKELRRRFPLICSGTPRALNHHRHADLDRFYKFGKNWPKSEFWKDFRPGREPSDFSEVNFISKAISRPLDEFSLLFRLLCTSF